MTERAVGTLISWHATRGYGYLRRDRGGVDVLVTRKGFLGSGIEDLQPGTRLSFVLAADDPRGPRAMNICVMSEPTP
jgi:cold shock CspA family protein